VIHTFGFLLHFTHLLETVTADHLGLLLFTSISHQWVFHEFKQQCNDATFGHQTLQQYKLEVSVLDVIPLNSLLCFFSIYSLPLSQVYSKAFAGKATLIKMQFIFYLFYLFTFTFLSWPKS